MKKLNKNLNKDITKLKELHTKFDKTEFMKQRDIVMKRHKMCKSTVYRLMKKSTPGLRHTASYYLSNSPITETEIKMVRELLLRQMPVNEIRVALERHTNESYPYRRIQRIRKEIDKRKWNDSDREESETNFDSNLRKLFIQYCNLDLIDPSRTARLELKGKEYRVNCGVINDSIDMLIYSAENDGMGTTEINRSRMEVMVTRKMDQITKGLHIAMYDLKALESIRRSLENTKQIVAHPDHRVLAECCRELKPDISDVAIFMLADKHQRLIHDSTEDIVPFRKEVHRLAAKEMQASM